MNYELLTSRSDILAYETCPRLRLLQSHTGPQGVGSLGIGYAPRKAAIPLAKGSSVHKGLQSLLEGRSTDDAVADALTEYDLLCKERGFQGVLEEDQAYTFAEQRVLTEMVVRLWALKRLPFFKENYDLLAVEREAPVAELAKGIGFQSRPDGVLRFRPTGFTEILSFKTASAWRDSQDEENENDIQGLSEPWTASQVFGPVGSVLMEYIILGQRKKPKEKVVDDDGFAEEIGESLGPKLQDSFLVRPWEVGYGKFAWKGRVRVDGRNASLGKFFDPAYGTKGKARTAILEQFGGEKWEAKRVPIWEQGIPTKEWFDLLASGRVFPYDEDPFDGLIISRKYERQAFELEEWRREAAAQELTVKEGLRRLDLAQRGMGHEKTQDILDSFFPRRRKACHNMYGNKCSMFKICWAGDVPGQSINYVERQPNHPLAAPEEGEE